MTVDLEALEIRTIKAGNETLDNFLAHQDAGYEISRKCQITVMFFRGSIRDMSK